MKRELVISLFLCFLAGSIWIIPILQEKSYYAIDKCVDRISKGTTDKKDIETVVQEGSRIIPNLEDAYSKYDNGGGLTSVFTCFGGIGDANAYQSVERILLRCPSDEKGSIIYAIGIGSKRFNRPIPLTFVKNLVVPIYASGIDKGAKDSIVYFFESVTDFIPMRHDNGYFNHHLMSRVWAEVLERYSSRIEWDPNSRYYSVNSLYLQVQEEITKSAPHGDVRREDRSESDAEPEKKDKGEKDVEK